MDAEQLAAILQSKSAPAVFTRSALEHAIKAVPSAYGKNNVFELFNEDDSRNIVAPNLGVKQYALNDELRNEMLLFKKHIDNAQMQAAHMSAKLKRSVPVESTPYFVRNIEPLLKTYNVTDFSTWIPTVNTRFYFEEFEIAPMLEQYFRKHPMSSKTDRVNSLTSRAIAKLEADDATFGAQAQTTSYIDLVAQDAVTHLLLTQDLMQDASPSVFEALRRDAVISVQRALERAILDGDTTSTHMDTDVSASTDFRKAFIGLRKKALANSANGSTYDHGGDYANRSLFDSMLRKSAKFGNDKKDLLWIVSPTVARSLESGAIPEIVTIQNAGAYATMFNGKIPPILGVEVYESEWQRETLGASGVYSSASTKTSILLVRKSRFIVGERGGMRVWASPSLPSSDNMLLTAKARYGFNGNNQDADEKSVLVGYNIETV
jgi:hypothetical protein